MNATFVEVDSKTKTTHDGRDFRKLNPLGLVPTLRTDDGAILSENAAILQYVADRVPGDLAPEIEASRDRAPAVALLHRHGAHKAIFRCCSRTPAEAKAYAFEKEKSRWEMLNTYLTDREFLLDQFSVADAYLVTV